MEPSHSQSGRYSLHGVAWGCMGLHGAAWECMGTKLWLLWLACCTGVPSVHQQRSRTRVNTDDLIEIVLQSFEDGVVDLMYEDTEYFESVCTGVNDFVVKLRKLRDLHDNKNIAEFKTKLQEVCEYGAIHDEAVRIGYLIHGKLAKKVRCAKCQCTASTVLHVCPQPNPQRCIGWCYTES